MINIFWSKFDRSGVSDQLNLLEDICNSRNIPYVISDRLCPYATNILIEEFNKKTAKYVQDFCALHQISIFVLVTEFLHVEDNYYFVNDISENLNIDLLPSDLFLQRFYYLNKLKGCIQGFISLLDLPSLEPYCTLFDVADSYRLSIPYKNFEIENINYQLDYDFYFSGSLTPYRIEVIELLSKIHRVYYEKTFVPEATRINNLLKCRYKIENFFMFLKKNARINVRNEKKYIYFESFIYMTLIEYYAGHLIKNKL
jgi:hypothetical protein